MSAGAAMPLRPRASGSYIDRLQTVLHGLPKITFAPAAFETPGRPDAKTPGRPETSCALPAISSTGRGDDDDDDDPLVCRRGMSVTGLDPALARLRRSFSQEDEDGVRSVLLDLVNGIESRDDRLRLTLALHGALSDTEEGVEDEARSSPPSPGSSLRSSGEDGGGDEDDDGVARGNAMVRRAVRSVLVTILGGAFGGAPSAAAGPAATARGHAALLPPPGTACVVCEACPPVLGLLRRSGWKCAACVHTSSSSSSGRRRGGTSSVPSSPRKRAGRRPLLSRGASDAAASVACSPEALSSRRLARP